MLKEGFLFTFISAFMALFPVANPVGAGFLVNGLLSGLDDEDRKSIIRRIITDYLLVGLGSLAVGHFVLTLFGLSLPVIQLGGGLLICRTALQWLSDSDSSVGHAQGKDVNPLHKIALESQVFYPITFPISIGPGSVSVILTLMASVSMKDGWAKRAALLCDHRAGNRADVPDPLPVPVAGRAHHTENRHQRQHRHQQDGRLLHLLRRRADRRDGHRQIIPLAPITENRAGN